MQRICSKCSETKCRESVTWGTQVSQTRCSTRCCRVSLTCPALFFSKRYLLKSLSGRCLSLNRTAISRTLAFICCWYMQEPIESRPTDRSPVSRNCLRRDRVINDDPITIQRTQLFGGPQSTNPKEIAMNIRYLPHSRLMLLTAILAGALAAFGQPG